MVENKKLVLIEKINTLLNMNIVLREYNFEIKYLIEDMNFIAITMIITFKK